MFNTKPGLFPKSADAHVARTLRPGSGTSIPSGSALSSTGAPAALSPPRDTAAAAGTTIEASAQTASTDAGAVREEERDKDTEKGSRLIVGPDVKLKGAEILDCDTLVVEGRVEATMDSRVIRIAEHGAYSGTVGIDIAEIHGHFDGELTARQRLIVHATGRVSGKIRYGTILIEEGGEISGDVKSLSATSRDAVRPALPAGESSGDERRVLSALAG